MNTKTKEKECGNEIYSLYRKQVTENKAVCAAAAEAAKRSVDDAALPDGEGADVAARHGGGGGHGAPPVAVLGCVGDKVDLYSMKYHRQKCLLPEKLDNRGNLVSLAPMDDWARFLFGDKEKPCELAIRRAAQDWICAEAGGKAFDPSSIRGRGVWKDEDSDGVAYNAGQACFLVRPDVGFEEFSPCRGNLVYSAGAALPKPSGEPLTDEEGALLVGLFEKRPWKMEHSGWDRAYVYIKYARKQLNISDMEIFLFRHIMLAYGPHILRQTGSAPQAGVALQEAGAWDEAGGTWPQDGQGAKLRLQI